MKQTRHWQLRLIQLMNQHLVEQKNLLATHEADRAQLRQQQQLIWQAHSLEPERAMQLLVDQGVARQRQDTQQAQQWWALQERQHLQERALQQQIEKEKVRQN